jgi:Protein of unknown function (DUF642)/PEP-CTERM motif
MLIRRFALHCVLSAFFSIFAGSAANGQLILNGSFELPGLVGNVGPGRQQYSAPTIDLTGWTVSGMGDVFLHKSPDIGTDAGSPFNFAQDGNFYLDLSGSYQNSAHAIVFQDFATNPFTTYELSFYIGASHQQAPAATINAQLIGTSTLLNTTLTPLASLTNINWSLQTFSFVADSTTTRLSFVDVSTNDDNTSFVDNISVAVVPEPSSLVLFAVGTLCFGAIRRCRRRAVAAEGTAEPSAAPDRGGYVA